MSQHNPEEGAFYMDEGLKDELNMNMTPAKYAATVVDLGPENEGQFGPADNTPAAHYDKLVTDMTNKEIYGRKNTGNWECVDGREDEAGVTDDDGEYANGQIPGSLPITNTAGDMMDSTRTGLLLSERVAANTDEAIQDGHQVIVHGDDHAGKDGCAANAKMRPTLAKIAANADIIGPRVWAFCEATAITDVITQDDITTAMVTAGQRASDDAIWDVTPTEVIDIAVAHGAKYRTLKGSHQERTVAATLKGTYASQRFAQDHLNPDGSRDEVFGLSVGDYVDTTIIDTMGRGATRRDGALKAMRGLVYAAGLTKKIGNPHLQIVALQKV